LDLRSAPSGPSLRGESTVLVVDDDDAIREYMRRVLVQLGYDVLIAANGDEALALASSDARPIDLLISDGVMPGLHGPELAAQLRRDRPDVAVLFVSGYADDLLTSAAR